MARRIGSSCAAKWLTHDTEIGRLPPLHKPNTNTVAFDWWRNCGFRRTAPSASMPWISSGSHANSGAGMLPRRDSRYPSAAFTRSGVNGVWRSRTPVSCAIALPIAGATSGVAIWPAPVGGLSVGSTSTCIAGTSFMRGTR
jgi:hypothetical protein